MQPIIGAFVETNDSRAKIAQAVEMELLDDGVIPLCARPPQASEESEVASWILKNLSFCHHIIRCLTSKAARTTVVDPIITPEAEALVKECMYDLEDLDGPEAILYVDDLSVFNFTTFSDRTEPPETVSQSSVFE